MKKYKFYAETNDNALIKTEIIKNTFPNCFINVIGIPYNGLWKVDVEVIFNEENLDFENYYTNNKEKIMTDLNLITFEELK